MARKSAQKSKGGSRMLPVLHPVAAGVDIGGDICRWCLQTVQQIRCDRSGLLHGTFTN